MQFCLLKRATKPWLNAFPPEWHANQAQPIFAEIPNGRLGPVCILMLTSPGRLIAERLCICAKLSTGNVDSEASFSKRFAWLKTLRAESMGQW